MKASSITFSLHTLETAPAASQPALNRLRKAVEAIPNLAGSMAESPVLIEVFAVRDKRPLAPTRAVAI